MSYDSIFCMMYVDAMFLCLGQMCGTAVFGFGVFLMLNTKVSALIPTLSSLNLANTLFITGIIITCVSFLGFLGALKENRCLLITFFILLFILMLVELTVACLLLVYESKIDRFLKQDLTQSLVNSKESAKGGNSTINKDDWDIIQTTVMEICSQCNFIDWKDKVPKSCCPKSQCGSTEKPVYWNAGCYNKLKVWFEDNFLVTGVGVIVLCIIEVLGMCFSMTLFCHISRSGLGYKL
uniref:Tetraspanin n=1 Tax=Hucho hucho TaxID=62062 RepID=A0A4W5QWX2_9TELE